MRVLNSDQMREADRRTIEDIGIPSIVLMIRGTESLRETSDKGGLAGAKIAVEQNVGGRFQAGGQLFRELVCLFFRS